jgi:hypothetical protein
MSPQRKRFLFPQHKPGADQYRDSSFAQFLATAIASHTVTKVTRSTL